MAAHVDFSPSNLNFGAVSPESSGPDISVDPSLGPPALSFSGALRIPSVSVSTNITAVIKSGSPYFRIRDVIALDWVWETVDPGELPPGHRGPPPKVRVLEITAQSDGREPFAVTIGQYVLVRVEYLAPAAGGDFAGVLSVTSDLWEPIELPLSFKLSYVSTSIADTPVALWQGTTTDVKIGTQVIAGPDSKVRFEISPTQIHSGVSIVGPSEFFATSALQDFTLTLRAAADSPIGDNTLAINKFFINMRSGFFVPITIKPFSSIQKIRGLKIFPEPSAISFLFTTDKSSKPVITIWKRSIRHDPVNEMVPANQVAVSLGGSIPQTSHDIRITGLPVGQALWFRIDAGVEDPGIPPSAFTTRSGETATLQRICQVKVWSVHVLGAGGDDGGPEDGNEIGFGFTVFNNANNEKLTFDRFADFGSVDNGEVLTPDFGVDGSVAVLNAPDTIVPYLKAVSQDPDISPPPGGTVLYWAMPETLPDSMDYGANGDGSWSDGVCSFSPPATMGNHQSDTMAISTGLVPVLSFLAELTVNSNITDPFGATVMRYPDEP